MKFEFVGLAFIIIIVVFIIVGLVRGIFKTIISFLKSTVSIVIAGFISRPFASLAVKTSLGKKWGSSIADSLSGKGEVFTKAFSEVKDNLDEVFSALKLPNVVSGLFSKLIDSSAVEFAETATVGEVIGLSVAYYAFTAIAFLAVLLIVRILCALLNKLFKALESVTTIKVANRVFGGVINGIYGLIVVSLVAYGLSFIIAIPGGFSDWLVSEMALGEDVFTFGKLIYEHNFFLWLLQAIQGLF